MFLGNKLEVHCKTLLWVMHREELNKYCLSAPLGGFVSYISLIPLPGMSCFIISEVYSGVSHDWFACGGLNSKLTEGRMPGKESGGGEEAGAGVSRCAPAAQCPGGLSCCRDSTAGQGSPWWCGGNEKEQEGKREKQKQQEETFVGIED